MEKKSVRAQREADIRRNSDREFKDRVITELSRNGVFRSWRCAKPGTGIFAFTITTIPGHLIITGDLGSLIVTRTYDMLPWCRGSCDSTDYFAEKVPHGLVIEKFSTDVLEEWITEMLADEDVSVEGKRTLREAIGTDEGPAEKWYERFREVWDGGDPPNWDMYTNRFLWCRDAIRWFVMNHDEPSLNTKESMQGS